MREMTDVPETALRCCAAPDRALLARVAARLRGEDPAAIPVPDGWLIPVHGDVLPRRVVRQVA
jgi:hypothetical protein